MLFKTIHIASFLLSSLVLSTQAQPMSANAKVISADEVKWGYLNPLRGNKSPGAANLWGDRTTEQATGMLVRFNEGFSSPPHIHNISYRGIVIDGLMHNDDPNAAKLWLPPTSFWTQPAGEDHVTAANAKTNLIYLEIDSGPYLVKPSKSKFDNGEVPISIHRNNMVWRVLPKAIEGVEITDLWGSWKNEELRGSLVRFNQGFEGHIISNAMEFRAVVISGSATYQAAKPNTKKYLSPGSYFDSTGRYSHILAVDEGTVLYLRTNGNYQLLPVK